MKRVVKNNHRRLSLTKITLARLDLEQLRDAKGGYAETGCLGQCNSLNVICMDLL